MADFTIEREMADSYLNRSDVSEAKKQDVKKWFKDTVHFRGMYSTMAKKLLTGDHAFVHHLPSDIYDHIFVEKGCSTWFLNSDDVYDTDNILNSFTSSDTANLIAPFLYEKHYPGNTINIQGLTDVLESFDDVWIPIPIGYAMEWIGHSVFICIHLKARKWMYIDNLGNDFATHSGVSRQAWSMMSELSQFSGYQFELELPFVEGIQASPLVAPRGTCVAWTAMIIRAICWKGFKPKEVYDQFTSYSKEQRKVMVEEFLKRVVSDSLQKM